MNPNKDCRQVLRECINQNPEGWKIRTAKTISTETELTEVDVNEYFEIATAEIHGGSSQRYFN